MPIWRVYFYLFLSIIIVLVGLGVHVFVKQEPSGLDTPIGKITNIKTFGNPGIGGSYSLTNQYGEAVSDEAFKGKFALIFFGYTFCPDICPTTIQTFSEVIVKLGRDSEKLKVIFITVDPVRDTPEQMRHYLSHFNDKIIGLTGSVGEIERVQKMFKVYAAKSASVAKDPSNYLIDHSSIGYLMDPDGGFVLFFKYGANAQEIAGKIKSLLEKKLSK